MGDGCQDVGLVGVGKEETSRVKLTEVNPHLVCVLCHGYFVDATTITECLHSFCRSCIFRHLETKSFCPICEVQVHARLHRSLKPDKTLQDIVYKLVPGLFHNEMERRRSFYKQHPFRDEHLEPERRGLGLDRLIYSPTDTISLSLEFYDTEREKEEWSSVTCPPPHQQDIPSPATSTTNNNNNKRYLQCPAIFKMAHLKKFLRQKYNLSPTANVEIIYKREFLPDSYSLMDVAYIYTWKRNGPMRFYYRIPDVVETEMPFEGNLIQEKHDIKTKSISKVTSPESSSSSPTSDLERNKQVLSAANLPVETEEKKLPQPTLNPEEEALLLKSVDTKKVRASPNKELSREVSTKSSTADFQPTKTEAEKNIFVSSVDSSEKTEKKIVIPKNTCDESSSKLVAINSKHPDENKAQNKIEAPEPKPSPPESVCSKEIDKTPSVVPPKVSKQDELPVEVLLSLSTCRVAKEMSPVPTATTRKEPSALPENNNLKISTEAKTNPTPKMKHSTNARMSLTKIAYELQQKAANNFIQKTSKENIVSPSKHKTDNPSGKASPNSKGVGLNKNVNVGNNINVRIVGNKRKSNGTISQGRSSFNDMNVMDHRIQQLYKYSGSPSNNGLVQMGQKTESRLANWLNNRFQAKPPGSPVHPGITASPGLATALSNQLALTGKVNGAKSSESLSPTGVNIDLQKGVNSSVKTTHSNLPQSVGFYNKNHNTANSVPVNNGSTTLVQNGKKHISEKRDKLKPPPILTNGVKKDSVSCKEPLPVSAQIKTNTTVPHASAKPPSPKKVEDTALGKSSSGVTSQPAAISLAQATSCVKDPSLNISHPVPSNNNLNKDRTLSVASNLPVGLTSTNKAPKSTSPYKEEKRINGENVCIPITNGKEAMNAEASNDHKEDLNKKNVERIEDAAKKPPEYKGDSSKWDEEVSLLKKKLEEMRKMSNVKGKEIGGCRITHENPDPEEAKRRRDLTPVVSIELMRGCKRPVPGLKSIQDMTDMSKKKGQDEKKELPEKKLKLSTVTKDISKKEETSCVLDLSRCGPPNSATPPHPWFNPLLHQQFLPSPK